jgi:hypothetical protein
VIIWFQEQINFVEVDTTVEEKKQAVEQVKEVEEVMLESISTVY